MKNIYTTFISNRKFSVFSSHLINIEWLKVLIFSFCQTIVEKSCCIGFCWKYWWTASGKQGPTVQHWTEPDRGDADSAGPLNSLLGANPLFSWCGPICWNFLFLKSVAVFRKSDIAYKYCCLKIHWIYVLLSIIVAILSPFTEI